MRFGGEDVVRHKLVQRIVEAYDEHAEQQAPELRPAQAREARAVLLEVEVIGLDRANGRRAAEEAEPCARSRSPRRGSTTATSRSSSSTRTRIRELNREHRERDAATDVLSFPVDEDGAPAGPRELGDIVICPEQTEDMREAVVHGALHLAGMDHETDDGEMLALQREILSWA